MRPPRTVPTLVGGEQYEAATKDVVKLDLGLNIKQGVDCGTIVFYLRVKDDINGKPKDRNLYMVPSIGTGQDYASCEDNKTNVVCALLERVCYHDVGNGFQHTLQTTRVDFHQRMLRFRNALKIFATELTPDPLLEYPAMVYRGRKLALYTRAALKVHQRGVLKTDSYLSTFLKHEKLPVGSKRVVPRVIQPRRPEYNVAVGRYLHKLEPVLYKVIDRVYGAPTVMKFYNAFQLGRLFHEAWGQFRDPVAVGLDASRFDQHVEAHMLQWEHSVYNLFYGAYPELRTLLKRQIHNSGFVRVHDATIKYYAYGKRCSGDMNTAMGNCLLMTAMIHEFLRQHHLASVGRTRVRLFNNGDDCVLIGERHDILSLLPAIPRYFSDLGFVMKVEPVVEVLEEVSFCQCQPVFDGTSFRMVRDPHASLSKDATLLEHYDSHRSATRRNRFSAQLLAIGDCGLALTGGLPVLQSYYNALRRGQRAGGPVDERFYQTGFYNLSKGLDIKERCVSDAARVSFTRAFGIVPDLQVELERYYDGLPTVTGGPFNYHAAPTVILK